MRVVLDTNVLVAAVATRGLCADILRAVLASHELLICRQIMEELRRNLASKLLVPADQVDEFLNVLRQGSEMVGPGKAPRISIKDREDLGIIAAALSGKAHALVTGDRELLGLKPLKGLRILSPRQFWDELKKGI